MAGLAFPLVLVIGEESLVNTSWENDLGQAHIWLFLYTAEEPLGSCQPLPGHWRAHGELVLGAGNLGQLFGVKYLGLCSKDGWVLGLDQVLGARCLGLLLGVTKAPFLFY